MEWYKMSAQEWYDRRKEWLEETAEEKRANPKKDCLVLMDYLDQFVDRVSYIYKPAIMLKDIDACKGYIPDIMIQLPGNVNLILDFVDTHSKYYSKEKIIQKACDLENDGYLYRYALKGRLSGKDAISPAEFMGIVADSFKEREGEE